MHELQVKGAVINCPFPPSLPWATVGMGMEFLVVEELIKIWQYLRLLSLCHINLFSMDTLYVGLGYPY